MTVRIAVALAAVFLGGAPAVVPAQADDPEGWVLWRAMYPLRTTYPTCPREIVESDGTWSYECRGAEGYSFEISIHAYATAEDARAAFEAVRQGEPSQPFHSHPAVYGQYDERPGDPDVPMRHRRFEWQSDRWLFRSAAFDATTPEVAADPRESGERLHEAAMAEGLLPTAPATNEVEVQDLGDLGGAASAVAVVAGVAYVGLGERLEILDLTEPESPHPIGRATLGGLATGIEVVGDYVFTALGADGLASNGVADPSEPSPGLASGSPAWDLALVGDHLLVAGGLNGLEVLDVSDPASPATVARLASPGDARAVAAAPGLALIANGVAGLQVVDISDPIDPMQVALVPIQSLDVALSGDLAVVASGDEWITLLDTSSPVPSQVRTVSTAPYQAATVEMVESTAYVGATHDSESVVALFDLTRPSDPVRTTTYQPTRPMFRCTDSFPWVTEWWKPRAAHLVVDGGRAFVAAWDAGLRVVDVAVGSVPVELGSYVGPFTCAVDVAVSGDHAYIAADLDGMHVASLAGAQPFETVGSLTGITGHRVTLSGGRAYVDDETSVSVVDVTAPEHPALIGRIGPFRFAIEDHAVQGDYVYVVESGPDSGIRIIDARDATMPRQVGSWSSPHQAVAVSVCGGTAYVLTVTYLHVVDVSDPAAPIGIGKLALPYALDVASAGGTALVVTDDSTISVDVTDAAHPRLVGSQAGDSYRTVAMSGAAGYLTGFAGLDLVDLRAPADPRRLAFSRLPRDGLAIALHGTRPVVARGTRGLKYLWTGPYSLPEGVGRIHLPSAGRGGAG